MGAIHTQTKLPLLATFRSAARNLYVDWDEATDVAVSGLREAAGSDLDDPYLRSLIDELSSASE